MNYNWPGNVRELENLMQRSALLTTTSMVSEFYQQPETVNPTYTTEK